MDDGYPHVSPIWFCVLDEKLSSSSIRCLYLLLLKSSVTPLDAILAFNGRGSDSYECGPDGIRTRAAFSKGQQASDSRVMRNKQGSQDYMRFGFLPDQSDKEFVAEYQKNPHPFVWTVSRLEQEATAH